MRPSSSLWIGIAILSVVVVGCSAANVPSPSSPAFDQSPAPSDSSASRSPETVAPSSSVACPGSPTPLAAILALSRDERLSCFGGSTITFRAVVVPTDVSCHPVTVEPAWLWCPPAAFLAAPPTAATDPGPGVGLAAAPSSPRGDGFVFVSLGVAMLEAYLAPAAASASAQLVPDGTILVTGHFDDPAALTCRVVSVAESPSPSPAEVVQGCRASFVITGVKSGTSG